MARKSMFVVVTNQNDPNLVRMFSEEEALAFVGPEYDKKGFILTKFEKKTETFFRVVEEEDKDVDDSPLPLDPDDDPSQVGGRASRRRVRE